MKSALAHGLLTHLNSNVDRPINECHKLFASEPPRPARHHVGILGDIISECPGDLIGIRIPREEFSEAQVHG
jgi:hypothetical protein